jgi:hypothetical protein
MAHPVGFREANTMLKKPEGSTSEECTDLEVYKDGKYTISRWQLSDEELIALQKNGGKLYLMFWGNTHPPVLPIVKSPF